MPQTRVLSTVEPESTLPADDHVHSEWSWDAIRGSMEETCERAVQLGVPAVSFTEHVDFVDWRLDDRVMAENVLRQLSELQRPWQVDLDGYFSSIEQCRSRFPTLKIRTGIELGEPHLYPQQTQNYLGGVQLDRLLGSLHSIHIDGRLDYVSAAIAGGHDVHSTTQEYLDELLRLVDSTDAYDILAHIDYPARSWHRVGKVFDPVDFEDAYRNVLRSLARSGRALEINTGGPRIAFVLATWWREAGGRAISFGSDAHSADKLARKFAEAIEIAKSAGFRPSDDPTDLWIRD